MRRVPAELGLLCLAVVLAGPRTAAAKPLSAEEDKVVRRCEAVFTRAPQASGAEPVFLNPTKASVCLKVLAVAGTVSGKMADRRLDPDAWRRVNRVLMNASALKDLGDVFSLHSTSGALRVALCKRTFCSGPLREMGLGPAPALLADWAASYRPAQAPLLDLVLGSWSWASLPEVMKPHLLAKTGAKDAAGWEALCLEKRPSALFWSADKAADELMAIPAASLDDAAGARVRDAAGALRPYLDADKETALADFAASVERFLALRRKYRSARKLPGGADAARLEEYSRKAEAGGLSLSEHMRYLSGIFGEDPGQGEVKGPAERKATVSWLGSEEALAARLLPAMLDEIRGTRSGDRVLAFFKDQAYPAADRKLAVRIAPLGTNLGMWNGKSIAISRENVEAWLLARGISDPAALARGQDPDRLRDLARYLAPTFIHEATHQEQQAWLAKNSLPNRYYVEREVEAMGVGALFVLEKNLQVAGQGDDSYLRGIHVLEVDRARRFYEDGLTGVRRFVAPSYSQIASFDTFAAEDFELAEAIEAELAKRALQSNEAEEDQWRDPDFMPFVTRINAVPYMRTAKLREVMKNSFSGYRKLSVQLDQRDAWLSEGLKAYKKREEVGR